METLLKDKVMWNMFKDIKNSIEIMKELAANEITQIDDIPDELFNETLGISDKCGIEKLKDIAFISNMHDEKYNEITIITDETTIITDTHDQKSIETTIISDIHDEKSNETIVISDMQNEKSIATTAVSDKLDKSKSEQLLSDLQISSDSEDGDKICKKDLIDNYEDNTDAIHIVDKDIITNCSEALYTNCQEDVTSNCQEVFANNCISYLKNNKDVTEDLTKNCIKVQNFAEGTVKNVVEDKIKINAEDTIQNCDKDLVTKLHEDIITNCDEDLIKKCQDIIANCVEDTANCEIGVIKDENKIKTDDEENDEDVVVDSDDDLVNEFFNVTAEDPMDKFLNFIEDDNLAELKRLENDRAVEETKKKRVSKGKDMALLMKYANFAQTSKPSRIVLKTDKKIKKETAKKLPNTKVKTTISKNKKKSPTVTKPKPVTKNDAILKVSKPRKLTLSEMRAIYSSDSDEETIVYHKKKRLSDTKPNNKPSTPPISSKPLELVKQPEIVNADVNVKNEEKPNEVWCICRVEKDDNMIACDHPGCAIEWFHYKCVGVPADFNTDNPWYCQICYYLPRYYSNNA